MSAVVIAPTDKDLCRFWSKVSLPDKNGCMLWRAGTNKGYGMFSVTPKGQVDVTIEAHRFVCIWAHGAPPSRPHEAAHNCPAGHRHCVAPNHLAWKTPVQNAADRLRDGTDARGEKCPTAKLTEAQARQILARPGERRRDLAAEFGVSRQAVNDLFWGRTWKDLPR